MINFKVFKTSDCLHWQFPFVCVCGEEFYRILTKYKRRGRLPFNCGQPVVNSKPRVWKVIRLFFNKRMRRCCSPGRHSPRAQSQSWFPYPISWHAHWKCCCQTANSVAGKTDKLCLSRFCRIVMKINSQAAACELSFSQSLQTQSVS